MCDWTISSQISCKINCKLTIANYDCGQHAETFDIFTESILCHSFIDINQKLDNFEKTVKKDFNRNTRLIKLIILSPYIMKVKIEPKKTDHPELCLFVNLLILSAEKLRVTQN